MRTRIVVLQWDSALRVRQRQPHFAQTVSFPHLHTQDTDSLFYRCSGFGTVHFTGKLKRLSFLFSLNKISASNAGTLLSVCGSFPNKCLKTFSDITCLQSVWRQFWSPRSRMVFIGKIKLVRFGSLAGDRISLRQLVAHLARFDSR